MSAAIKKAKAEEVAVIVNANGMTPLMQAVCEDSIDLVRALLDSGVDVNAKRDDGFTALVLAAFFGQTGIVELLLERGADIHAKTRFGTSALMWARARGFPKIVNVLQKAERGVAAERAPHAKQKSPSESKLRAAKLLPEVVEPLPVIAETFHPGQVFIARVTSSPKGLAALAAMIVAVLGLGIFATYRISRTASDNTGQQPPAVNETMVDSKTPVEHNTPQQSVPSESNEAPDSQVLSNHTVKPTIKTFSSPITARSSFARPRQQMVARKAEVTVQQEVETESKPAPLTVEVSRERTAPPSTTKPDETPRTQPAPLGITSSKPHTKVIQWP